MVANALSFGWLRLHFSGDTAPKGLRLRYDKSLVNGRVSEPPPVTFQVVGIRDAYLKQTDHLAVVVQVNVIVAWARAQARHRLHSTT